MYVGAETGYGGFLIIFATRGPCKMSEAEGQYLTAVYWGSLAVGRVIAIPLSLKLKPSAQLLADLLLCTIGVTLLLAGLVVKTGGSNSGFLWAGSAVYGLGMASVFPSAFMQAESLVDLTGRVASVLIVGSATGEMILPLALGLVTVYWASGFVLVISIATLSFAVPAVILCAQNITTNDAYLRNEPTKETGVEITTMNPIGQSSSV
jgi:FHS family Na+ dependent glucose MFS transporter 1